MAYATANLNLVSQPFGAPNAPRFFSYYNADADADATIVGSGYFSDGVTKGMRVADIVDAVNPTTAKYKRYQVTSVSGAAATVSAPTAIT